MENREVSYYTEYLKSFQVTIPDPETGDDVIAEAYFWFYGGWQGTRTQPPEPPEVVIDVIMIGDVNVTNKVSTECIRHLEGVIMEELLQNNFDC